MGPARWSSGACVFIPSWISPIGEDFCFDAFSSREPVPTEPVIERAFARPVGSKTLYSDGTAPLRDEFEQVRDAG
jgi:hypothetical protein